MTSQNKNQTLRDLSLLILLSLVLSMQYKIRYNPMHLLYGTLPGPYEPVRVTRGLNWSHIGTLMSLLAAEPRTIALLFISVERSWWPCIRWCGTSGFEDQGQCLFIGLTALSLSVSDCFPFHFFHSIYWFCWSWVFGLIRC